MTCCEYFCVRKGKKQGKEYANNVFLLQVKCRGFILLLPLKERLGFFSREVICLYSKIFTNNKK